MLRVVSSSQCPLNSVVAAAAVEAVLMVWKEGRPCRPAAGGAIQPVRPL